MRVPRGLIGKVVEVAWIDPTSSLRREELASAARGRASLSTWVEYGRVVDVTDGVVLLAHSLGTSPGEAAPDEGMLTRVVEDLITDLKVLAPERGEASSTGSAA